MRKFFLSLFFVAFFLIFPAPVFAECESGSITFYPETGTTNTTFGFGGTITNCSSQTGGSLRLIGALQGSAGGRGGEPFNYTLQTNASGNFSGNGKFTTPGTYTLRIVYTGSTGATNVTLASQPTITVTAGRAYQCGEAVSEGTSCPTACPNIFDTAANTWRCGEALRSDEQARCATTITLSQLTQCSNALGKIAAPTTRCGPNDSGYFCANPSHQLCLNGEALEKNVVCLDPSPVPQPTPPCAEGSWEDGKCTAFQTAVGKIDTDPMGFIKRIFGLLLGLSGGVAVVLIMIGGYQLMMSQGNKETVQSARERITSAIVGLLFLIFSLVILQIIGVDILSIPGFR